MKMEWPLRGRLQQGTVFSGCLVAGYDGRPGWGLVVTARCDLANDKVPLLNYLPVVKFSDWLELDGRASLISRASSEEEASLSQLLTDLGATESVLRSAELAVVLRELLGEVRPGAKLAQRCERAISRNAEFAKPEGPSIEWLCEQYPKLYAGIVRELMTQRLAGYYFLPAVEPNEAPSCYVVLLRHIGSMPFEVACRIPAGISIDDVRAGFSAAVRYLCLDGEDDYVMPLGVIPSPNIEHLMQVFSSLLSRIGLPNVDSQHIEKYAMGGR